ncbi:hypothetical protein B0H13DRAFT_2262610 [Mycena leptocephala]|nr:hypothetical protein B0H13DRAFT_2262610 [Mycena leptocephala]
MDDLITEYRKRRTAAPVVVMAAVTVPREATRSVVSGRGGTAWVAGPPALLTLTDDATQLRNMDRFLAYLVELEPLIDGYTGIANQTSLQTHVNKRLDFLLPFREQGSSRIHSRGSVAAFDRAHSGTWAGLFSGLIFRGVTFASPFGLQATKTLFTGVSDWETECVKFKKPAEHFFCNPWVYSKRKSKRSVSLVAEYWDAVTTKGCPDWETNTASGNHAFRSCYDFLKQTNPSQFREIGSLAGFLLAADFSYAGVVQPPMVAERANGVGRTYNMADINEVRAGFCRLHGFLDRNLGNTQKLHKVFDAILVENGLCKFTRVMGENDSMQCNAFALAASHCTGGYCIGISSVSAGNAMQCNSMQCNAKV